MNNKTEELYQIINKMGICGSIQKFGNLLYEFIERAKNISNRRQYIAELNNRLVYSGRAMHLADRFFSVSNQEKKIKILEKKEAVANYIYSKFSLISMDDKPLKILSNLEVLATELTQDYSASTDPLIEKVTVQSVLEYLEEEYDFSQRIISDSERAFISIVDTKHNVLDAVTSISIKDAVCVNSDIYLFRTHIEKDSNETPEAIFFHELAHMIFARKTGLFSPSAEMITTTRESFGWLRDADNDQISEAIIDFLAVGLMYGSPFQKFSRLGEALGELECAQHKKMAEALLNR